MLEINTKAPNFALPDQDGIERKLSDYRGKLLLIYFYPKDDTPGCTKEACMITEAYDEFEKEGIAVIGISADSPEQHTKFRTKYGLPFTLLSDTERVIIEAYGAKNILGGTKRISYLLEGNGIVVKAYPKVTPATHASDVLKDVRTMLGK